MDFHGVQELLGKSFALAQTAEWELISITGGREQEDDDNYRFRIRLKILSTSSANEEFLRSQILPIPGIQDVVFERQTGTFNCYVYAISPLASASLLANVQQTLNVIWPTRRPVRRSIQTSSVFPWKPPSS
jgi:hypothetical protein